MEAGKLGSRTSSRLQEDHGRGWMGEVWVDHLAEIAYLQGRARVVVQLS